MCFLNSPASPDPPQIVSFKSLTSTTVITAPSNIALQCEVSPLASLPISFVITRTSNGITEQVFAVNNASVRVNYTSGPSKASSTGTYRCSASNSVRSDSRELQITVKGDALCECSMRDEDEYDGLRCG